MGWIYQIFNKINKKSYIGATTNIFERIGNHKNKLKRNSHFNKGLQEDYNIFGIENFSFNVLKDGVEKDKMDEYERFFVSLFDSFKNGYNRTSGGKSGFEISEENIKRMKDRKGEKNYMYGKNHTKESIRKMIENKPDMSGKNNPMYGVEMSKESIEKRLRNTEFKYGEENPLSKIKEREVYEIYYRYYNGYETTEKISKNYNISPELVSHIINNNHYYSKNLRKLKRNKDNKIKAYSNYKITKKIGLKIYKLYKTGSYQIKELSNDFNVGIYSISKIINGEHWTTKNLESITKRTIKSNPPMSKVEANKIYLLYQQGDKSLKELIENSDYSKSTIKKAATGNHYTQK